MCKAQELSDGVHAELHGKSIALIAIPDFSSMPLERLAYAVVYTTFERALMMDKSHREALIGRTLRSGFDEPIARFLQDVNSEEFELLFGENSYGARNRDVAFDHYIPR